MRGGSADSQTEGGSLAEGVACNEDHGEGPGRGAVRCRVAHSAPATPRAKGQPAPKHHHKMGKWHWLAL
jgi:hypothetical protein